MLTRGKRAVPNIGNIQNAWIGGQDLGVSIGSAYSFDCVDADSASTSREANEMVTISLYNPDENGVLKRTDRIPEYVIESLLLLS